MQVKQIDTSFEVTLENLQSYMAEVCSVVRDKSPKNNVKLWERLLKESYGNTPSSTFSFIPCVLEAQAVLGTLMNTEEMQFFGYFKNGQYYTNMREVLNWGASVEDAILSVDFRGYKAFKCVAPYFVYQQIRTHSQMQFISHSARYTASTHGYWKPSEVDADALYSSWNNTVKFTPPHILEHTMKNQGVVRREVFSRGKDMLQNRVFTVGGNFNNPNSFPHFLNERGKSLHTQLETREFVKLLEEEL